MAPRRKRQQGKAKAQEKNLKRLFVRQNSDARHAMLNKEYRRCADTSLAAIAVAPDKWDKDRWYLWCRMFDCSLYRPEGIPRPTEKDEAAVQELIDSVEEPPHFRAYGALMLLRWFTRYAKKKDDIEGYQNRAAELNHQVQDLTKTSNAGQHSSRLVGIDPFNETEPTDYVKLDYMLKAICNGAKSMRTLWDFTSPPLERPLDAGKEAAELLQQGLVPEVAKIMQERHTIDLPTEVWEEYSHVFLNNLATGRLKPCASPAPEVTDELIAQVHALPVKADISFYIIENSNGTLAVMEVNKRKMDQADAIAKKAIKLIRFVKILDRDDMGRSLVAAFCQACLEPSMLQDSSPPHRPQAARFASFDYGTQLPMFQRLGCSDVDSLHDPMFCKLLKENMNEIFATNMFKKKETPITTDYFRGIVCGSCGKAGQVGKKLMGCSCGDAYYCNRECQLAHWKNHKIDCKAKASTNGSGQK